jgi:hypothetical protein
MPSPLPSLPARDPMAAPANADAAIGHTSIDYESTRDLVRETISRLTPTEQHLLLSELLAEVE